MPINHQVDLYALGAILFEMLSGRKPYQSKSIAGLLSAHLHEKIPNICELRPDLPPAIQGVIEKALAKNPTQRYQNADEMVSDLHDVFPNIKGVTNMTPTPAPVIFESTLQSRQGKAKPWIGFALAGIGVLALLGGFLFWRNQNSNITPSGNQHPASRVGSS
jgi:serine/threonine-protein kinase